MLTPSAQAVDPGGLTEATDAGASGRGPFLHLFRLCTGSGPCSHGEKGGAGSGEKGHAGATHEGMPWDHLVITHLLIAGDREADVPHFQEYGQLG